MSALANGAAAAPTIDPRAGMFDIDDPPHNYQILVPDPKAPAEPAKPAAPVATVATPAPAAPAQPVGSPPAPTQPPAPSAAPAAAPAAPPAPKHPKWLTDAAESQGMHPLVLDRLDTQELNQIVVSTMARQLAERNANIAAQTVTAPPPVQQTQQPAPVGAHPVPAAPIQPAPVQPQAPAFDWGVHPDIDDRTGLPTAPRQYTDADINPALAAHIKALHAEVAGMKAFIQTMNKTVAESTEQKIQRDFDAEFQKYPQVFGVGDGKAVAGKPEFERRRIVYQSVKAMFQTLPPEARAAVSLAGAVQNYTKTLFGADPVGAAPAPATVAAPAAPANPGQNFVGGALAVPTQRKADPATPGRAAAIDATTEWWNANKATQAAGGASEGTSLNEFL